MSRNDVSVTETAQSDQYLPAAAAATHQYYRYYNHKHAHNVSQQQQQQLQQQLQQQQQQQQSCLLHIAPHTPQPQQQHKLQAALHWQQQQQQQQQHVGNSSSEFDEFHWPSKHGQGSKIYITPSDIPPPPPHPHSNNSHHNGSKRFLQQQQQQQQQQSLPAPPTTPHGQRHAGAPGAAATSTTTHRCKCEHPIELLSYEDTAADVVLSADAHSVHTAHPHTHSHRHAPYYYKPAMANNSSGSYQLKRHSIKLHESMLGGSSLDDDDLASSSGFGAGMARFKNLVYSKEKKRRKRTILSVVAAIVIVALVSVTLVFLLTGNDDDNISKGDNAIDLEDVLTGQLYAKRFNGSWSQGSNVIYKENGAIVEYDAKNNNRSVLLANASEYILFEKSSDNQLLLLAKNYKKNFRYSFLAEYDIYNLSSHSFAALTIQNEQRFLSMVQWAPVGNALIINYERNLYYKPSALEPEIAITSDENGAFLNGIPDWVYEEEVFSSNVATWFNTDGTQIAFIRFDDSNTPVINFPYYGDAGDLRYQYPLHQIIAYPKAGSSNPRVQLFIANLERAVSGSDFLTEMPVPSGLNTETDYIVTVVSWLNSTHVLSTWMNRIQNAAYVVTFDGNLNRRVIYSAESKTGWVDIYTAPFKNRDASRIAFILPHNNYKHVTLLSTLITSADQQQLEALTEGNFVVDSILHWDTTHDIIFYTANTANNPEQMHLYAIRAVTTSKQTPKCLTCQLMQSGNVQQTYFSAIFNDNNQIVISSLGPGVPTTAIYEWSYANSEVKLNKVLDWETNEILREKLKGVAMPTHEIVTVGIDTNFSAQVLLQLPPNLDKSGKTKYPVLVDVYGGPDSSSVTDKWILDWGTYLSSNQSVIYAKIDGRGSGLRGESLLHAIYLKLGTVEISDQIFVMEYLANSLDYIDAEHIGIWGWSYGGYAAAMALANDDKVFKCAASIAPVTDWAYYDSIYTERYMGLPIINEIGYANSRLSTRANKLRGKKYLLVHGTLDDNVHYQQAMILAKNLERNDILFKQISYTDEDHGLANVRPHLYHSLDRFFGECFANNRLMRSAK